MRGGVSSRLPMSSCRGVLKKTYSCAGFLNHAIKYGNHSICTFVPCGLWCVGGASRKASVLWCNVKLFYMASVGCHLSIKCLSGYVIGTDDVCGVGLLEEIILKQI
jgi:hypothetical protein